ncbi:MAG: YdcF family protein [Akkermansiaceae bacterium]|nr:YdcF family protein [Akkermansiaceae bacterium]
MPAESDMTKDRAVRLLWEYHRMHQPPEPADIIFVLGSNDPRVAVHAARLFLRGLAPLLLFSGGTGRFTAGQSVSEAERFARVAGQEGVPARCMLIENRSANTGENIRFSRALLEREGVAVRKVLAVQKPYMERRTFASMQVQWPGVETRVSSPPLTFEEYLTPELTGDFVINAMVGDFQRVLEYPKRGFAAEQPVPGDVMRAFECLVSLGYTAQLMR